MSTLQQLAPIVPLILWGCVVAGALAGGVLGWLIVDTILAHRKPFSPKGNPPS